MALTQQDKEEMYQYLITRGKSLGSLDEGDSNLSNKYLAPVLEYSGGTASKAVRLAVSLLQGKSAVLRKSGDLVQWQLQGASTWETLYSMADYKGLPGANGKNPVFRKNAANLEYKLDGEEDTAYKFLVALSDITGPEGDHVVLRVQDGKLEYKQSKAADSTYQQLLIIEDMRGPQGRPGKDFQILGYYDTIADLQTAITSPEPGEAYGVGTAAPYPIYIWDAVSQDWVNNGAIQGPAGRSGKSARVNTETGYWEEFDDDTQAWKQTEVIAVYPIATAERDGLMSKDAAAKVAKIITSGDGTKALLDNGEYGTVSGGGSGDYVEKFNFPLLELMMTSDGTNESISQIIGGVEGFEKYWTEFETTMLAGKVLPLISGSTANVTTNSTEDGSYKEFIFSLTMAGESMSVGLELKDGVFSLKQYATPATQYAAEIYSLEDERLQRDGLNLISTTKDLSRGNTLSLLREDDFAYLGQDTSNSAKIRYNGRLIILNKNDGSVIVTRKLEQYLGFVNHLSLYEMLDWNAKSTGVCTIDSYNRITLSISKITPLLNTTLFSWDKRDVNQPMQFTQYQPWVFLINCTKKNASDSDISLTFDFGYSRKRTITITNTLNDLYYIEGIDHQPRIDEIKISGASGGELVIKGIGLLYGNYIPITIPLNYRDIIFLAKKEILEELSQSK